MNQRNRYLSAQSRIFKALGHPSRLIMADALARNKLCVRELQALVGSDMSTISKHLTVMKDAGLVRDEKRGTNVYYSLELDCLEIFLRRTDELVRRQAHERLALLDGDSPGAGETEL